MRSSAQIGAAPLYLGFVQANVEPALAKSHALSNELAGALLQLRVALKIMLPVKAASLAVLDRDVAEHKVQKADIWTARDVTFTSADKLTPATFRRPRPIPTRTRRRSSTPMGSPSTLKAFRRTAR
jgi:hypothetical protein